MTEKEKVAKSSISPDWFMRGALTKIGDTLDAITGRRWVPSSTLATSELIERTKRLLDSEAKEVAGKGRVAPHNIKLKMQWDKFSTDSEAALENLRNEFLAAAADHINDSLYYTYAPLHVEVKPDYFTEGVKLYVGFDIFADEETDAEMNLTIAGVQFQPSYLPKEITQASSRSNYLFRFTVNGQEREKRFEFKAGRRVSVGRTPNNDMAIDHTSVSKIHASLMVDGDGNLTVADTGSTNGTFINGERMAYGKALVLKEVDKVRFGTIEVLFERLVSDEKPIEKPTSDAPIAIKGLEFRSRETMVDLEPPPSLPGEETAKMEGRSEEISQADTEPNLPNISDAEGNK
ncbi:MAG: FHA domain-containing protein [Acidobacteria bacterium]|nr:FHA domain-containing protein [Acidobacteriota bacterium]